MLFYGRGCSTSESSSNSIRKGLWQYFGRTNYIPCRQFYKGQCAAMWQLLAVIHLSTCHKYCRPQPPIPKISTYLMIVLANITLFNNL